MACHSSVNRNQFIYLTACYTLNWRIITLPGRSIKPSVSQPIGQTISELIRRKVTLTVRLQANQYIKNSISRSFNLSVSQCNGQSNSRPIYRSVDTWTSESVSQCVILSISKPIGQTTYRIINTSASQSVRSVNLPVSHSVGQSIGHPFG